MQEGNVLAIRLCARFQGWTITARNGYLAIDIGSKAVDRNPFGFKRIVSELNRVDGALEGINGLTQTTFKPSLPGSLFTAGEIARGGDERPLRVLSCDGGGMRGISSLLFWQAVMNKAVPGQEPWQIFDMIGGTSTGGLIAIMLGRLRMKVQECIDFYRDTMNEVFKTSCLGKQVDFLRRGEFYDAGPLEARIKKLVKERLGNEDEKLFDGREDACKVFAITTRRDAANNHAPVQLRSYSNPLVPPTLHDIKVWEAARATSAAPAYFRPIKVGDYELIDGGLGANNPSGWLWTEILGVFGASRKTNCFLSIGTGIDVNKTLPKPGVLGSHDVEIGFANVATNSEITHILFHGLIDSFAPQAMTPKYFRLNLDEKDPRNPDNYVGVPELDDIKQFEPFRVRAEDYIKTHGDEISKCAGAVC